MKVQNIKEYWDSAALEKLRLWESFLYVHSKIASLVWNALLNI